jgi:hypothetical protein
MSWAALVANVVLGDDALSANAPASWADAASAVSPSSVKIFQILDAVMMFTAANGNEWFRFQFNKGRGGECEYKTAARRDIWLVGKSSGNFLAVRFQIQTE